MPMYEDVLPKAMIERPPIGIKTTRHKQEKHMNTGRLACLSL